MVGSRPKIDGHRATELRFDRRDHFLAVFFLATVFFTVRLTVFFAAVFLAAFFFAPAFCALKAAIFSGVATWIPMLAANLGGCIGGIARVTLPGYKHIFAPIVLAPSLERSRNIAFATRCSPQDVRRKMLGVVGGIKGLERRFPCIVLRLSPSLKI